MNLEPGAKDRAFYPGLALRVSLLPSKLDSSLLGVFLALRIGFGFHNFNNYRIRASLYAGKPNWRVLGSIVVQ
jgi:hypothetical protein